MVVVGGCDSAQTIVPSDEAHSPLPGVWFGRSPDGAQMFWVIDFADGDMNDGDFVRREIMPLVGGIFENRPEERNIFYSIQKSKSIDLSHKYEVKLALGVSRLRLS